MNSQRPLSRRKQVQLLVVLTILCWATQTLLSQWGFGQSAGIAGGKVSLRERASVVGGEVRLEQVARVVPGSGLPASMGGLVVHRFAAGQTRTEIELDALRPMLAAAGMNLGKVEFGGSVRCAVVRADGGGVPEAQTFTEYGVKSVGPTASAAGVSLRDRLLGDLSNRLGVDVKDLDVRFEPADEALLRLSEPHVQFEISARRAEALGAVAWDVRIETGEGVQKQTVRAMARAWQDRQVIRQPVLTRQVIRAQDVETRRVLVEAGGSERLGETRTAVGQMASRDLRPGMVLSGSVIEPAPLVRSGQVVTLTADRGGIRVRTVARAMETGTFGQPVKVRNESTRDVYTAIVSGPHAVTLGEPDPSAADDAVAQAAGLGRTE